MFFFGGIYLCIDTKGKEGRKKEKEQQNKGIESNGMRYKEQNEQALFKVQHENLSYYLLCVYNNNYYYYCCITTHTRTYTPTLTLTPQTNNNKKNEIIYYSTTFYIFH